MVSCPCNSIALRTKREGLLDLLAANLTPFSVRFLFQRVKVGIAGYLVFSGFWMFTHKHMYPPYLRITHTHMHTRIHTHKTFFFFKKVKFKGRHKWALSTTEDPFRCRLWTWRVDYTNSISRWTTILSYLENRDTMTTLSCLRLKGFCSWDVGRSLSVCLI